MQQEAKRETIQIRLPGSLLERLRELAAEQERTVSSATRLALRQYVERGSEERAGRP